MKSLFPGPACTAAWHRRTLGADPFTSDVNAARRSFFGPAGAACRRPVSAEKLLPSRLPAALRRELGLSLRLWQASQRVTADYLFRGRRPRGMDMPMTLNFSMALGNYARYPLFSAGKRLGHKAALAIHAAFAAEMALAPAEMALGRLTPSASAARLARAFLPALEDLP